MLQKKRKPRYVFNTKKRNKNKNDNILKNKCLFNGIQNIMAIQQKIRLKILNVSFI